MAAIFVALAIPNCARISPHSKLNPIYNNLRQLDGAKQQWAIENKVTGMVQISEKDIFPYLGRGLHDFKEITVANERYTINSLGVSPEVYLTKKIEHLPRGTVIRFSTNNPLEFETIGSVSV